MEIGEFASFDRLYTINQGSEKKLLQFRHTVLRKEDCVKSPLSTSEFGFNPPLIEKMCQTANLHLKNKAMRLLITH